VPSNNIDVTGGRDGFPLITNACGADFIERYYSIMGTGGTIEASICGLTFKGLLQLFVTSPCDTCDRQASTG